MIQMGSMGLRLKYALPLVQMGLAVVFLRLEFVNELTWRMADSRGFHPAFILLLCLSFPVTLPLKLTLYGYLPTLWFDAIVVAAIGAFWYWAALQMHSYHERRTLLPFSSVPLQITADLLLIAIGACLGWLLLRQVREYPNYFSPFKITLSPFNLGWLWLIPIWASLRIWSLGPVFVFGQDLIRHTCASRPKP